MGDITWYIAVSVALNWFRQIVIDVGIMYHCFIFDIPGHQFFIRFLHEGQLTTRSICLSLSIVDLPRCRYKCHLDLPPDYGYMSPC